MASRSQQVVPGKPAQADPGRTHSTGCDDAGATMPTTAYRATVDG